MSKEAFSTDVAEFGLDVAVDLLQYESEDSRVDYERLFHDAGDIAIRAA